MLREHAHRVDPQHKDLPHPAWVPYAVDKALQAQSRQRRFRRFLGNERVEAHRAYAPIITEALRSLLLPKLFLALDTTRLWAGHTRISLILNGRTIPLAWKTLPHRSSMISYADYRELLNAVQQTLPEGARVVLLADRGFDSVDLMEHCDRPGLEIPHPPQGLPQCLSAAFEMPSARACSPNAGERPSSSTTSTSPAARPGHTIWLWPNPREFRETWMIASNEPTSAETFKEYGERFGIEENFLDDKSNGFGWEESRLLDPEALDRLVLVLATATLYLSLQDARVEAEGRRTEADPHWFRGLSYFKIGWSWIKRALEHGEKILQAWVFPKHFRPAPAQASRKQHQALLR